MWYGMVRWGNELQAWRSDGVAGIGGEGYGGLRAGVS